MCGIVGYLKLQSQIDKKTNQDKFNPDLNTMLDLIKHRGPDDKGIYKDNYISLGHQRLSILDLSLAGRQPMVSSDQNLVVVYNGEIYNYLELKKELEQKGCIFKTQTDTEVILAAYQTWGEECVEKFNGMWAFVIWDKKNKKLFASRDRFGIKPLFYYQDNEVFVFASEMKCLLAFLKNKPGINYAFLYNFIDRQITQGDNQTVFNHINFLLPAHNLIIDLKSKKIEIKKHWNFEPKKFRKKYDYSNSVKTFRELLIDAVKIRLRSDVPVSVCLSGGIDSSVITCIITKILKQKIPTFSSIYYQKECNEKEFIDEVNKECETHPYLIYPTPDNFFNVVKLLVHHHDLPVGMTGTYSQWHVFKCVAEHAIVTLDGQGADELMAGYIYYYPYYLADLIKNLSFIRYFQTHKKVKKYTNKNYSKDVLKILFPCLASFKHLFIKPKERWHNKILNNDFIKKYGSKEITEKEPKVYKSYLNQVLFKTFTTTNLPMLLDNEDRISMSFSLEARVPFLDYRLVEFCFGMDTKQKMNGYTTKHILREAFKDVLPKKVYERKDKKGFPVPLAEWFRNELKEDLQKMFNSSEFGKYNILDKQKVQKLFKEHLAGQDRSRLLWKVITLHYWLKEYV